LHRPAAASPLPERSPAPTAPIFAAVDRLIERADGRRALGAHRLQLLAARHWRSQGRPVPALFVVFELRAVARLEVARELLSIVSSALDQDAIAVKGMAVAELYPDPYLRPFADLDLLVADAPAAQQRLLDAGFRAVATRQTQEFYDVHHHLQPLQWPGRESVPVEIHSRAPWVRWCPPPSFATLSAGTTATAWDRIRFPDPSVHAAILAAHAWHTLPLRHISDVLDVALMRAAAGGAPADAVAAEFGIDRLWRATQSAAAALLDGGRTPLSLRIWGRDLPEVRGRSLAEHHLRRLLGPFWERPLPAASRDALGVLAADLRPVGDESWTEKLGRVRHGLRRPLSPVHTHNERLGSSAQQLRRRR
jgi:hypothetical protein